MKHGEFVRTTINIPRRLHRELHDAAERRGCSPSQLILQGIEPVIAESVPQRPKRRLSLDPPIVGLPGNHLI